MPDSIGQRRFAARLERAAARVVGKPAFWVVLLSALFAWPMAWSLATPLPPPLPVLAEVPPFLLTDQDGRPFGSGDLAGRVWVASFVFTRCHGACPSITRAVARLQGRTRHLEPAFHLVTFTVDPAYDTPARLAAYAKSARASPRLWTFLTGPDVEVRRAVVEGLRVTMGGTPGPGDDDQVLHGTTLVLVDGKGRIRGFYDPESPGAEDRLVRDAGLLVNRGAGGTT